MVNLLTLFFSTPALAFTLAEAGFEGAWASKTVTFYYNSANCPASVSGALDKAIDLWNSVPTSGLKVKRGGISNATPAGLAGGSNSGPMPAIVCDPNFEATSPGVNGDVTGGYGFFNHAGSQINYGGLVLNVQSGKRNSINNYNATSLAILMAHEIGHVLGLGHSEYHPALMYYDIGSKGNLIFAQDDIDGITYLYPRDELKDGIYGCGMISSEKLPPASGAAALILVVLPIVMLFWLRRRAATDYATA